MDLGTDDPNRLVGEDAQKAAEDAQAETAVAPPRRFIVKLMQTVEVCSEQYPYSEDEGVSNKKEALAKAQAFVDDEKDLEKGTYRLVVEEVENEPTVADTPPAEPTE